ncbi:PREDICTED: wiskott-Aldrich syndrome protein family member 2-like [Priapulus caudatus]|uniref:Wiskott-Aldrich syndrome protein family member n=1 Tax=Priapulus caudatus TaxID=37621 RepID=A0ABM1E4A6_PRICU|nr:PREDICTED: wiskott-Aldrich syndrome protein family member 2-like [Priapulus caudatus]
MHPYRSTVENEQQVVVHSNMTPCVTAQYDICDAPPNLRIFNDFRSDGKDGLKFYSNPDFFFELWKEEILRDAAKVKQERVKKPNQPGTKQQRKGPRRVKDHRAKFHEKAMETEFIKRKEARRSSSARTEAKKHSDAVSDGTSPPDDTSKHDSKVTETAENAQKRKHDEKRADHVDGSSTLDDDRPPTPPPPYDPTTPPLTAKGNRKGSRPLISQSVARKLSRRSERTSRPSLPPPPPPPGSTKRQTMDFPPPPPPDQLIDDAFEDLPPPPPGSMFEDLPPPPPGSVLEMDHVLPATTAALPMLNSSKTGGPAPPPAPPSAPTPPVAPAPPAPPQQGSFASTVDSSQTRRSLRKASRSHVPPVIDARGDLLNSIIKGIKLKKVEEKKENEKKLQSCADVASILARRIAVEYSDSDDDDMETGSDGSEWEDDDY